MNSIKKAHLNFGSHSIETIGRKLFIHNFLIFALSYIGLNSAFATNGVITRVEVEGIQFSSNIEFEGGPESFKERLLGPWVSALSSNLTMKNELSSAEFEINGSREECAFCLDSLVDVKKLGLTHCKHVTCLSCHQDWATGRWDRWPNSNLVCPTCCAPDATKGLLVLEKISPTEYEVYSPNEGLESPTGAVLEFAKDHVIAGRSSRPARILTRGWMLPETKTWYGRVIKGITWYTRAGVANENEKFIFSSANQSQAAAICHDPNDPSVGLPTVKEINQLMKVLGNSTEGSAFFRDRFIGIGGDFWLSDERFGKGAMITHLNPSIVFVEQDLPLGVICVKR